MVEVAAGIGVLTAANFAANHVVRRVPRFVYALLVIFLAGTVVPTFALRALVGDVGQPAILQFAPLPLAAAGLVGGVFLLSAMRDEDAAQWRRLPGLLIALFAPSLAEVLVFLGIVFGSVETLLWESVGRWPATIAAILLTSASFALYHLTHAAPWSEWRVVKILFVVWLGIGAFFALTQNLWAAALLNTLMATVGFVKNRVTRPEEQPVFVSLLMDVLAVVAVLAILQLTEMPF
jgi:hypothetical protein